MPRCLTLNFGKLQQLTFINEKSASNFWNMIVLLSLIFYSYTLCDKTLREFIDYVKRQCSRCVRPQFLFICIILIIEISAVKCQSKALTTNHQCKINIERFPCGKRRCDKYRMGMSVSAAKPTPRSYPSDRWIQTESPKENENTSTNFARQNVEFWERKGRLNYLSCLGARYIAWPPENRLYRKST